MLVNPWYFLDFAARHNRITDVRIMPREGSFSNEMNDYRFDVVLRVDGESGEGGDVPPASSPLEATWEPGLDLEGLLEVSAGAVCLRGYPNRRVWAAQALSRMLDGTHDLKDEEARLAGEADGFLPLSQLATAGMRHGYRLHPRLCLTGERAPARFDLFF